MYQYLPIEQAKSGDIVQAITNYDNSYSKDNFYIVHRAYRTSSTIETVVDDKGKTNGMAAKNFKLIATKYTVKIGDTVICIKETTGDCNINDSFVVDYISEQSIGPKPGTNFRGQLSAKGWHWRKEYFRTLCEEPSTEKLQTRRNLAFYKRSGILWTQEEYLNILQYTEGVLPCHAVSIDLSECIKYKFVFDNNFRNSFQFLWKEQENHPNFRNCTQVAYEDIFNTDKTPRVAIVTKKAYLGHPIGSRIIQEDPKIPSSNWQYWILLDDVHEQAKWNRIGVHCMWEDEINKTFTVKPTDSSYTLNKQNPCSEIFLPDLPNILNKPTQKEKQMPSNFQEILSSIFGMDKPTTDYDKRPAILVVVYSLDGKKVATATAESIELVAKEVKRNPELWGCKVLTYKLSKELFVDVPVTINKAQVASESEVE